MAALKSGFITTCVCVCLPLKQVKILIVKKVASVLIVFFVLFRKVRRKSWICFRLLVFVTSAVMSFILIVI